jgi:hypothetical protein
MTRLKLLHADLPTPRRIRSSDPGTALMRSPDQSLDIGRGRL